MSENISMQNALKALQQNVQGKDFSGLNEKVVNDVSLFETVNGQEQFNDKLTNKDDFISAFKTGNDEADIPNEQLSAIYDMLDTDGNGQINQDELKLFASLGGQDKLNSIDVKDFEALVNLSKTSTATTGAQQPGVNQPAQNDSQEGKQVTTVLNNDPRIQQDANSQKFVNVETWGSGENANDCLEAIVKNSYNLDAMGIQYGSNEFQSLLNAVMDANPQIYGNSQEGNGNRADTVLYDNDKVILPNVQFLKNIVQAQSTAAGEVVGSNYGESHSSYQGEGYGDNGSEKTTNDTQNIETKSWADFRKEDEENSKKYNEPSMSDFKRMQDTPPKTEGDIRQEAQAEAMEKIIHPEQSSYHPAGLTDKDMENIYRKEQV